MRVASLLLLLIASPAIAADYRWPILEVVDGDTIAVELDGLPPELRRVLVRIRGVDAPETGGKAGCASERRLAARATDFTRERVAGDVVFRQPSWDKFGGRIDADVIVGGRSLGDELVGAGLAHRYNGRGKRPGWCQG